jgi:hypothetical protein
VSFNVILVYASTRYEYYNTGDDNAVGAFGTTWWAQSFTVGASAHTVTSVKLKLYRIGTPGTFIVSIRATDEDGYPTGSDLTSGTIDGNALTTSTTGEWYEITVTEYVLLANTKYAIVCRAPNGDDSNQVVLRRDASDPTYEGGSNGATYDGGISWAMYIWQDLMFEIWGNPILRNWHDVETWNVMLNTTGLLASQTLLVDGFTATNTMWYKVGSSPYLTYVDYPNNYIWQRPSAEGATDNWYTFQNHSAVGTFVRLEYRVYCKYIWSGSNYYAILRLGWSVGTSESSNQYYFYSGFDWTWLSGNITVVTSWSDVDNLKLAIELAGFDPTNGQFLIDCVQIVAYYIPTTAHDVETWFVKLAGKLWSSVETWLIGLGTKIWNTAEIWSFVLNLGEQYSVSLMRYGLFFTGLLCVGFSLIGGVKKHDSMELAIFWILVFFIGIGLLISVGGMW